MASAQVPSTQAVLRREIPWQTYMTARLLSDRDLQLIRKYERKSGAALETALDEVRDSWSACTWAGPPRTLLMDH